MADRIMMSDEEMEQVTGGDIAVNSKKQYVKNTTTGVAYPMTGAVDAKTISDWVYANYAKLGGDDGIIAGLKEKGWIS